MSGKKYPWSKKDDSPASGVYAGPDFFGIGRAKPDEAPMNDVYAGPEFYERSTDDAPTEPIDLPTDDLPVDEPDEAAPSSDEAAPLPDDLIPRPDDLPQPPPEMFMCVYAGPEYWSNDGRPAGVFVPAPEEKTEPENAEPEDDDPAKITCPTCKNRIYPAKFCSECGALLPQDGPQNV